MADLPASVTILQLPTGTTITGGTLFEALQTVNGVQLSVQLPASAIMTTSIGALPSGGATGQFPTKVSGTNYVTQWTGISSIVTVTTGLATSGSATSIVVAVSTGGISSTQLANNAVGTNQIASSLGIASTLSIGGGLQVIGTSIFTGAFVLGNNGAGVLVSSSTGVVSASATAGAMTLLNTLLPNGVASTNDTTSFTSSYRNYLITFENVVPAVNTTTLQMQIATAGSNFVSGSYVSIAQVNVSSVLVTDTSTTVVLLSGLRSTTQVGTSTNYGVAGFINLFNPAGTIARKQIVGAFTYATPGTVGTTTLAQADINSLFDGNSNAVTGVNFLFSSGNIATGTIRIYGMV